MSKAFTKEDGPDVAPVRRRRAPLPEGTPNYVTKRGLQALRDELAQLDAAPTEWRAELEHRIATAVVVEAPEHPAEVRFGATVRVQDGEGATRALHIVGVDEADAAHGLIAFTAPLARALLGRRMGDVASVRTPGGEEDLTIIEIAYDH